MSNPYSTPDPNAKPAEPAARPGPVQQPGGQPPRSTQGHTGQQRPKPSPEEQVAGRKALWRFLLTVLGGAIVMMLPHPLPLLGVVVVPAAFVIGIWALPKVLKLWPRGPNLFSWILSMVFNVYLSFSVLGSLMLYPQITEYRECLTGALTTQAKRTCEVEYQHGVDSFLENLMPSGFGG